MTGQRTLQRLSCRLVFGDADAVRTAHVVQFFELLGGGKKDGGWDGSGMSSARLAILPGVRTIRFFHRRSWFPR